MNQETTQNTTTKQEINKQETIIEPTELLRLKAGEWSLPPVPPKKKTRE